VTGVRLTDDERESLWDADESCGCIGVADRVLEAVERILTDRLAAHEAREARVRALADKWKRAEATRHMRFMPANATETERRWAANSLNLRGAA